ncbi:hypothetical protein ACFPVT_08410 [Corynebacterium choanae]|uniref:hypothetical protein n=1 Tax=Corynebacterium choanae TaxID=1862358 RepID=UPI000F4FEA0B|nr:hypothetical protein [Corynebacterium choanae]
MNLEPVVLVALVAALLMDDGAAVAGVLPQGSAEEKVMRDVEVSITAGRRGLGSLLTRACHLDSQTLARFNVLDAPMAQPRSARNAATAGDNLASAAAEPAPADTRGVSAIDVYVTTPFSVFGSRRCAGVVDRHGAVVSAARLAEYVQQHPLQGRGDQPVGAAKPVAPAVEDSIVLPALDASWPGMMPPQASRFVHVDRIPAHVVRDLVGEGKRLARQFSGPLGPPASLLDGIVVEATRDEYAVAIPMRMVLALTSLGFVAPADSSFPQEIRVATHGSWVRLDAAFGSVVWAAGVLGLQR